ncbi:Serine/arginine-rich splicing factor RS2Z33-like [Oopsacas minuta]|uniref:Serine/arginine-rich splicing factor RS2Z33-like n=1 Tax=Oopsacas minuta TaxID=111878 RepID=A0AAV7JTR0_9METZ|nr:Serine/arginine-rich splicing factor RS2Z33-like [Oopsacas minuta]
MASEQVQGRKIAITGHGFDVTESDIRNIFDRFGEISEVVYIRNKDTGKSKGFSFVVYKDHASAQRAINTMHHDFIFDRRVSVEFARLHKPDDLFPGNYSPGLAKPPPFHHPHGTNPDSFRHVRRPQPNEFFHPRPPSEPRFPFLPGYPPLARSEMNHSPPNRFHTPTLRSEFPKEKSLEVIQEPEIAQHPLATPSSLSGASEQEDGEIPSGPERKILEPLEDGEMLDTGTPTQKLTDLPDDTAFRSLQPRKPSQFSISNWKIDADTEKLLENIIRIQGSIKIDSNEAQRVWAQGGLRKESESSPPADLESRHPKPAPDQLSTVMGQMERNEREITTPNIDPSARPTNWNHGRNVDPSNPNEHRWEDKRTGPQGSTPQEGRLSKSMPMEPQHMLGHPLHEGRDWAPPSGSRHRPDLRHILGQDNHIVDPNQGNYNYNSYRFQRSIQEPPSRPPYSHPPPSRHVHLPLRHHIPDSQYQSFPQQQQGLPMRGHPSQPGYMGGPGLHPSQDLHQSAPPPMMEQSQGSYDLMHQHPHSDNYPYAPMHMQDHNNSMSGYSMQFPGGNTSLSIDQSVGIQEHSIAPHAMGPQHQQLPMDIPGQILGNETGTNYQISPATIAQATIAQAAVNSDQCQDLSRSKDPMTLMSRMYVGNLDPKQVTKEDLHDTFSVYGRILDIKIHNHFAFIQFDNPFSCMDAIHTAHSNTIQGQQPKLQLAADGQRARNEMISSGNTASLPPDSKELPPNVPYPNPFRGQSGHLPTFLTVQPTQPQPIEPSIAPPSNFQPSAPIQISAGIPQPIGPQQAILTPGQNPLPGPGIVPQPIQPPGNLSQPTQEAANAQINAQLLSTALGMDPTALATILSSLPMLAKAKDESSEAKKTQYTKLHPKNSVDPSKAKKDNSEKESKKRKKKEGEKHAKNKRLNEIEAKKQKAKKKEEELAKVRARLAREITSSKDIKFKERVKHKSETRHDAKTKHSHSEEVFKKIIKQDASIAKDHSKHRQESKSLTEPTTSREREDKASITKENKNSTDNRDRSASDKSQHKSSHESKSHKNHTNHGKSRKRSRNSESPSSVRESPSKHDDLMDQYAYLYDMMTRNPMNKLIKDYHDYYVGIYGYNFSHWSSEYERFLEDYPMEEDTKEMLELMESYRGYPYYYGSMCCSATGNPDTVDAGGITGSPKSIPDQTKRMKGLDESKQPDASQAPK